MWGWFYRLDRAVFLFARVIAGDVQAIFGRRMAGARTGDRARRHDRPMPAGKCPAFAAALLAGGLAAPAPASDEAGVFAQSLVFGQSAAFSGPAAALGEGMRAGISAAFDEANRAGGVSGRLLHLIAYDDGYEPASAIANTVKLIEEDRVFALIGGVGTPTSRAVQPIATDAGVPFVGAFTGAGFLRDPALHNVVNVRASYDQEAAAWIDFLVDGRGMARIAILYQDDSFGRAGLAGVRQALEKRGLDLVAKGAYRRNTTAVKRALLAIRKAAPEAVVLVGAYEPAARFIALARTYGPDATFVTISFVGAYALARELGAAGEGVLVTQVVPLPDRSDSPLVARYRDAMAAIGADADIGFVSLEGYVAARLVIEALGQIGEDVTRQRFLDAIKDGGHFDIDGFRLTFGPGDNQGSDAVFLTEILADGHLGTVEPPATAGRPCRDATDCRP